VDIIVPGFGQEPRNESPGEAQVRLASWLIDVAGIFKVHFYPFEQTALAKAVGPFIRRWPALAKWKAPKK
jgi:hypothetical protein